MNVFGLRLWFPLWILSWVTQSEQSVGTTDDVSQVRHHKRLALAGDDTLYGTRDTWSQVYPRTPNRPGAKERERVVQIKDYDGVPFRMTGLTTFLRRGSCHCTIFLPDCCALLMVSAACLCYGGKASPSKVRIPPPTLPSSPSTSESTKRRPRVRADNTSRASWSRPGDSSVVSLV